MSNQPPLRVGIVGLGANTRLRHVPGLRACENVEILGVCNRSERSTADASEAFGIPRRYSAWSQLVEDSQIDAVVIGTWPYLHCEIACAALAAGKHVLTEARMARNLAEARQMLAASQQRPDLVAQIVPSPLGLRAHREVLRRLESGFLGELRELAVLGTNGQLNDPQLPMHWRQDEQLSGLNMLALGILHETLIRWVPSPRHVQASTHIFTPQRPDPTTGESQSVGTPDSVHVLTELPGGARGLYHLSGVMHHGPAFQIHLYGTRGTLEYEFAPHDRLFAGTGEGPLEEVEIAADQEGGWRVEEEFVRAIRGLEEVRFTDFSTGVRYMEFTESVARAAATGQRQTLEG